MRRIGQLVLVIMVLAGLGLAGAWLYQAGYATGAAADGTGPVIVTGPGFGFGFGGIFGILGFLLFLFLLFGLLRFAFRGQGGYRHGWGRPGPPWGDRSYGAAGGGSPERGLGPWEERARTIHDEWHRGTETGTAGPRDKEAPAGER